MSMRASYFFGFLFVTALICSCSGRDDGEPGGVDSGRPDTGGGDVDSGPGEDSGTPVDSGGDVDGGVTDSGISDTGPIDPDGCSPPVCPSPPPGCRYEGATRCTCGTLFCPPPGSTCGGFTGASCGPSEFCDYMRGDYCGAADATGVCMVRPEICPDIFMPVCGCDGMSYGNACEAHARGTDDAADGECDAPPPPPPPADCRVTGCPMGQHCDACLTPDGVAYACIPDGAAC
jgi:hypothetical protein